MAIRVLQDWVLELGYYDQAHLLAALRGMDVEKGNEITKPAVKLFRRTIGSNVKEMVKNGYATDEIIEPNKLAYIISNGKSYSEHWYEHFIKAIKIISTKHPNCFVRYYWSQVISTIEENSIG